MPSHSEQPRSNQQHRIVVILTALIVVSVAGVAIWRSEPSHQTSASESLCTELALVASYNASHPPKHTYPDLKATLTFANRHYASVVHPPAIEVSNLAKAVSSSSAMIDVIDKIMAKQSFTSAQNKASLNDILIWRKSTNALTHWQKSHCPSK